MKSASKAHPLMMNKRIGSASSNNIENLGKL